MFMQNYKTLSKIIIYILSNGIVQFQQQYKPCTRVQAINMNNNKKKREGEKKKKRKNAKAYVQ